MSKSLDKIYIRDLHLRCIVGIYPEERTNKQDVIINVILRCDLRKAGETDQIEDTVNYKFVKKGIASLVESSEFLLIERMADAIAALCLEEQGVEQVQVTVDKPGPCALPGVWRLKSREAARPAMADRGAPYVFLSVAANLEPEKNIEVALEQLSEQFAIEAVSTFYRTAAIDRPRQPDYLNGVVRIRSGLAPGELKSTVLRPIEKRLGRVRSDDAYAARCIDLDILLYGEYLVCDRELTIPDPDIVDRPFLSAGLLELEPHMVLPGDTCPLAERVDPEVLSALTEDPTFTQRIKELYIP